MTDSKPFFGQFLSMGLISASIIGFQLSLMWYFSNTQWHHFAFMVISVALLGFGASGTFITVFRPFTLRYHKKLTAGAMLLCAVFMTVCIPLCQWQLFRFDSLLLFSQSTQIFRLAATCMTLFIPFFFGGLAIGLILIRNMEKIGRFYFINLVGSGVGGLGSLSLYWFLTPSQLPMVPALLPLLSAVIFYWKKSFFHFFTLSVLGLMVVYFLNPPDLYMSEFKSLSKTLLLPQAKIRHEQATPFGFIQIVSSPALRYAPGLSLQYQENIPASDALFVNGDWLGPVFDTHQDGRHHVFNYSPMALPFYIQHSKRILSLSSGTGSLVSQALTHKPEQIIALETNPILPGLLNFLYSDRSIYSQARVDVRAVTDYTYLLLSDQDHDLILLPILDTFGGSAGLYALGEQYHLTREAFALMWESLSDTGMISISTWLDYPVRNPLRILSTLVSLLESRGIDQFKDHIVSVRSWNMITFVLKKSAFTTQETTLVREFALKMNFDPVLLPDIREQDLGRFNKLQDHDFFRFIDELMGNGRDHFIENYEFNLAPATENNPYFSQYLKLQHLFRLGDFFTASSIPFLELGYLLLLMSLVLVSLLALVLILFPLMNRKWSGSQKPWTMVYFAALGMGFMFIEIVLIQQFILYFGNPLYAAAAVISAVLLFSGLGSLFTSHLPASHRTILCCLMMIMAVAVFYTFGLGFLLKQTIGLNFYQKILLTLGFIGPLALLMGMPFPLGLRLAEKINPLNIPWAWSINGCSSVISAVLAAILALEYGFSSVMLAAACMYGTACIATLLISFK